MLNFNVTNIANTGREIYLWHRIGKTLHVFKDKTFYPYFYQIAYNGLFRTIDGQRVNKIVCSRPSDVKRKRDDNSYEADVLFTKRYIIDKISSFGKVDIKYSFTDIEVLAKELPSYLNPIYPISCISCSNSYTKKIITFFLKDYLTTMAIHPTEKKLTIEDGEKILLDNFVKWIKEQQFDLLLGWNFIEFDWIYLSARYRYLFGCELSEMLSPIAQAKYLGSSKKDTAPNLIPAGLSVCDYLDFYKKIYKTEPSYSLDAIAQTQLKETTYKKVDFSRLTNEIKEKNINDVKRMMKLEEKFKIIEYYDELRRMSMCDWSDVTWNSKMLDMILLKEAKQKGIILPSKKYGKEELTDDNIDKAVKESTKNSRAIKETFKGAYRRCNIEDEEGNMTEKLTGFYKNLWKLDLSSAYPMAIIEYCLDIANIRDNDGVDVNGIKFHQNKGALLPTIAQKLINKKDVLKKQLGLLDPESNEAKDLQIKYDAIKAVVNSLFGVCGLKIFRLFDYRVAASITFLIRDLLHYVEDKLKEKNIKVIYIDTDSVFVQSEENPKDLCNELIKEWAINKYNKNNIGIEFDFEGQFIKIFIVALCHYKGYLKKAKTGKIKEEIKGIEVKRKDSSNFIKEFQNNLIEKIMNEESKESIIEWINSEKERIKTLPLIDIAFPCKLSKQKEAYRSIPIFMRALEYTQEMISFEKRLGDSFYYLYVEPFGTAIRKSSRYMTNKETKEKELKVSEKEVPKNVLVLDEENYQHIKQVDWKQMLNRSIYSKCRHIFEALGWDIKEIKKEEDKKPRKKRSKNAK